MFPFVTFYIANVTHKGRDTKDSIHYIYKNNKYVLDLLLFYNARNGCFCIKHNKKSSVCHYFYTFVSTDFMLAPKELKAVLITI